MPRLHIANDANGQTWNPVQKGQQLSAVSVPVVLASDQAPIAITASEAGGGLPGQASVATLLCRAVAAGATLSKLQWPSTYTVTLPAANSGAAGVANILASSNVIGGVFSPGVSWGGVILDFAGVGAADLTAVVEIGRLAMNGPSANAVMPQVLASVSLKSITTSGTFTANINPFTGAAAAATTYRLFDLVTLTAKSALAEVLLNVGGAEDNTPSQLLLDTTHSPYYYCVLTSISTLTEVAMCITPQP